MKTIQSKDFAVSRVDKRPHGGKQSYPYLIVNIVYEDGSKRRRGDAPKGDKESVVQTSPQVVTRLSVRAGKNNLNSSLDSIWLEGEVSFEEFAKARETNAPLAGWSMSCTGREEFIRVNRMVIETR
jgi:hypothetical protein